jgi:peptide deformylase
VLGHLINPVLHFPDGEEQDGPEGCLSIPGLHFDTKRRQNVIASGFNEYGDPAQITGEGMLARCVQHETDHLDGVLFIDRLDPEARKAAMREIRESEWFGLERPTVKISPHPTGGLGL